MIHLHPAESLPHPPNDHTHTPIPYQTCNLHPLNNDMEYRKIISVTGLPGLYELVSSKNDGALVRSLEDRNTRFVSSRVHNFSHLESIEVYTTGENVNLAEVLLTMQASSSPLPDEKDAAAVRKYFSEVYPQIDLERVYNSDMKKMVRWLGILRKAGVTIEAPKQAEESDVQDADA
jgi:hypothetical protein